MLENKNSVKLAIRTLIWKQNTKSAPWTEEYVQKLGTRSKPLFKDTPMDTLYSVIPKNIDNPLPKKMQLPLSIRHRYFNKALSNYIKQHNFKQIIILGSGLDTRPINKKKYTDNYQVNFFEVDKKSVLQYKRNILENCKIEPNSTMIEINYTKDDLIDLLKEKNVNFEKPTCFLWEGNSMYLTNDEIINLFNNIKMHFGMFVVLLDYIHSSFISVQQSSQIANTTKDNFKNTKTALINGYRNAGDIASQLNFQVVDDQLVSDLEKQYEVENEPFETAKQYSVCTLSYTK